MSRTFNTLFLLQSVDGKISTGNVDTLDVDMDLKRIHGIKEGLSQYYDIEKTTDQFSLNSGRVMAKIGVNLRTDEPKKMGCSFIIIDNRPHLTQKGVMYLSKWVKTLYIVTKNKEHPAFNLKATFRNIEILLYEDIVDFTDLFVQMKNKYHADRITIQSGGNLNAGFLRESLIDEISVVIAPCLIGGEQTSTLVDGKSLETEPDLLKIRPLKLIEAKTLKDSYLHLRYTVENEVVIDSK